MKADYLRHLKWLAPVALLLLNAVLTVIQGTYGNQVLLYAVVFMWGLLVGIAFTIIAYSLGGREPRWRTKKTYIVPVGNVALRFHMQVAKDSDDPLPSPAGVFCATHRTPVAVIDAGSFDDFRTYWECQVCKTRTPALEQTSERARAVALQRWRGREPSDE